MLVLSAGFCRRVADWSISNTFMPTPDVIPKGAFLDLPCSKQSIEIGRECKKYQIDPIILETISFLLIYISIIKIS